MSDIADLLVKLEAEVNNAKAELKALEQQRYSLQLEVNNLKAEIGDHMENLKTLRELRSVQAAARKFADQESYS